MFFERQNGELKENVEWEIAFAGRRELVKLREARAEGVSSCRERGVLGGGCEGDEGVSMSFEWMGTLNALFR